MRSKLGCKTKQVQTGIVALSLGRMSRHAGAVGQGRCARSPGKGVAVAESFERVRRPARRGTENVRARRCGGLSLRAEGYRKSSNPELRPRRMLVVTERSVSLFRLSDGTAFAFLTSWDRMSSSAGARRRRACSNDRQIIVGRSTRHVSAGQQVAGLRERRRGQPSPQGALGTSLVPPRETEGLRARPAETSQLMPNRVYNSRLRRVSRSLAAVQFRPHQLTLPGL